MQHPHALREPAHESSRGRILPEHLEMGDAPVDHDERHRTIPEVLIRDVGVVDRLRPTRLRDHRVEVSAGRGIVGKAKRCGSDYAWERT